MALGKIDDSIIDEAGKALLVQGAGRELMENQLVKVSTELNRLNELNDENLDALDDLLSQVEALCAARGLQEKVPNEEDKERGSQLISLTQDECQVIREKVPYFETLKKVSIQHDDSWDVYMQNIKCYAEENHIDLTKDPFDALLSEAQKAEIAQRIREDYMMQKAHCDKYDYMIAAFCGVAAGIIDALFVGMPESSKLGNWTDEKADDFVKKFAQGIWNRDNSIRENLKNSGLTKNEVKEKLKEKGLPDSMPKEMPDSLQKCIQYLENKYKVNYDAAYANKLDDTKGALEHMWTKNHHLKSLAHAPDLIGLIFSILDQFTGKATFIDDGKIIRLVPKANKKAFELRGKTFPAKLYCGFCNWLGHLVSDYVGSNTSRTEQSVKRGSGLGIPFYELLQFINVGSFEVKGSNDKIEILTLAELSIKVFEKGYDLRFAEAMAIPVGLNEVMIRLLWSLKSKFYHRNSWEASIPFGNHPELRRMLLIGHGTLCLVDGIDATIKSKMEILDFALHLNFVAWGRLAFAALKEVRACYKEKVIDVELLDEDMEKEWNMLFSSSSIAL